MFIEDESSSMGDKWSSNSPFMYYGLPGKARMGFNDVVLPFAWNERVQRGK